MATRVVAIVAAVMVTGCGQRLDSFACTDDASAKAGTRLRVAGCTWGGSAILTRMIAAPGMFLEFGNRVRTTRIREVRHLRCTAAPTIH